MVVWSARRCWRSSTRWAARPAASCSGSSGRTRRCCRRASGARAAGCRRHGPTSAGSTRCPRNPRSRVGRSVAPAMYEPDSGRFEGSYRGAPRSPLRGVACTASRLPRPRPVHGVPAQERRSACSWAGHARVPHTRVSASPYTLNLRLFPCSPVISYNV